MAADDSDADTGEALDSEASDGDILDRPLDREDSSMLVDELFQLDFRSCHTYASLRPYTRLLILITSQARAYVLDRVLRLYDRGALLSDELDAVLVDCNLFRIFTGLDNDTISVVGLLDSVVNALALLDVDGTGFLVSSPISVTVVRLVILVRRFAPNIAAALLLPLALALATGCLSLVKLVIG